MKVIGCCLKVSVIIFSICISACSLYKDAGQITAMAKNFEEEGKMVVGEINAIKERASRVNYSNGVDEPEARALAEKYLLDIYPQWLGWQINVEDTGNTWNLVCKFVGAVEKMKLDKKTGFIDLEPLPKPQSLRSHGEEKNTPRFF